MSILKNLANKVIQRVVSSEKGQALLGSVLKKITLAALAKKFDSAGLANVFASWVGKGKNMPISPDQVKGLVGEAEIQKLADEHQVSPAEIESLLAAHLPDLVDQLSPDGALPAEAD